MKLKYAAYFLTLAVMVFPLYLLLTQDGNMRADDQERVYQPASSATESEQSSAPFTSDNKISSSSSNGSSEGTVHSAKEFVEQKQKDQYQVDEDNLLDDFRSLMEQYNENPTGIVAIKISKILKICQAYSFEDDLESNYASIEEVGGLAGMSNGDILDNIDRITVLHSDCKEIDKNTSILQSYDFAVAAAKLGDTEAQITLAAFYKHPEYDSMDENTKLRYEHEMGEMLKKAVKQCNAKAIYSISKYGDPKFDMYWKFKEGKPEKVDKIASLMTLVEIEQSGRDTGLRPYYESELIELIESASETEVSLAVGKAKNTYQSYCVGLN